MRANTVKQKLLRGEPSIGAEAGLGSVLSAEMLSRVGFDYVVVDMQHGAWTETSVMHAFRAIALGSALPMARVRSNDFGLIGRLLDIGAMGVIVPLVNSVEDAEKAVLAARYPPLGGRSGGNFGTGFLSDDPDDYQERANEEIFLAVQIESAPAVESAEGIMAVEGIDGCWIGPGRPVGLDGDDAREPGAHGGDPVGDRGVSQHGEDTGDFAGERGACPFLD